MSKELPVVEESSKLNFVTSIWIVPIIALFIALWLAFQYFSQLGPEITITFESNQGLKAGQSEVKFRNVPIGKVESIKLNDDGAGVKVTARINKEAADYLNENAKFWIVKPEVGMRGISGLDTILTGTYIELSGKKSVMNKSLFVGLQTPYKALEAGDYFHLNAPKSFGVEKGTPVYFKSMKAGFVEYVGISIDSKSIDVVIFIDKRYLSYIHEDSKFWVQSSLNINYDNGELNFNVAPMSHILRGGIEFSSSGENAKSKVSDDYIFRLYKNSTIAFEKKIGLGGNTIRDYYLEFNQTTAKLRIDAPIKYEKFDVGRVKDIAYRYDSKSHKLKSKIVVSIDTSIFYDPNEANRTGEENLKLAIQEGLKASMQEHDPISGLLYIDLAFYDDKSNRDIIYGDKYALLPTIATKDAGLMSGINKLIDSITKLPLEDLVLSIEHAIDEFSGILKENKESTHQMMTNLNKTLEGVNKMVGNKDFAKLPTELNKSMRELQKTLKSLDSLLKSNSNNSLMSSQLTQTLKELNKTSKNTRKLLKKLDRKPNALIFGD